MQVQISEEAYSEVKNASNILGFNEQNIIERAIVVYLDMIQKQIELKQEFQQWDELSDETLNNFENALQK
ncbi:MAG: hypothetical protein CVT88_04910 [Candidatus Altiarchaeales archaeon HGW-Altiarchaeales-1]|nr:MAG: hypothetical protein CVT89_04305 [Candidatus Altiarchaeales archaeon HGW-Altiarchaeales-2]PKP59667.1 MAG: hypothetical protein CVT88_04910 [Candidatus Altiarchaeales archaeon HGW-Altiarchaeales-1]